MCDDGVDREVVVGDSQDREDVGLHDGHDDVECSPEVSGTTVTGGGSTSLTTSTKMALANRTPNSRKLNVTVLIADLGESGLATGRAA